MASQERTGAGTIKDGTLVKESLCTHAGKTAWAKGMVAALSIHGIERCLLVQVCERLPWCFPDSWLPKGIEGSNALFPRWRRLSSSRRHKANSPAVGSASTATFLLSQATPRTADKTNHDGPTCTSPVVITTNAVTDLPNEVCAPLSSRLRLPSSCYAALKSPEISRPISPRI